MAPQVQPSANTPAIPAEIWMHVAQFIPNTDLCSMININGVFFQLSMNARYRELKFGIDSDAETLRRFHERVRDPLISHRVRHLCINLQYGNAFLRQFNQEGHLNPERNSISLLDGIQIITETVVSLTNITEFSVRWSEFPRKQHVIPLLTTAWKSFGSRLRKLSFQGSLDYLAALLSTVDRLVVLRDLNVNVCMRPDNGETDGDVLVTALAPFINKVAPTLHSFSYFSSLKDLDPSPFFYHLEEIPNLDRLCIFVRNSGNSLIEPFEATRFLCNHATTLRHLNWTWSNLSLPEKYLMDLLSGKDLEETFSNLCTLRLQVPRNPGGFAMAVNRIRCSAQTLNSLGLLGYDLTYEEVKTVISIFTPHSAVNLKKLRFWVKFLSPELILLLVQTVPHLETLAIEAEHVIGHEAEQGTSEAINADNVEDQKLAECLNSRIFADTMRTYNFRGWVLHDIDIRVAAWDINLSKKFMWVLAECVPSVQTFCGKDKEFYAIPHHDRL